MWLLKNYFESVLVQNSLRNLLNFRSTNMSKFLEITVLVPFSTTTPVRNSYSKNSPTLRKREPQWGFVIAIVLTRVQRSANRGVWIKRQSGTVSSSSFYF